MRAYLIRRIAMTIPVVIFLSMVVFSLVRFTGDPVLMIAGPEIDEATRLRMAKKWGLDKPVHVQYLTWIGRMIRGDFGRSWLYKKPVLKVYLSKIPVSLEIAAVGAAMAVVIGLGLGILTALNANGPLDSIGKAVAVAGQAIPTFWMGLSLMLVFAVWLRWLPAAGRGTLAHVILPGFTMGSFHIAALLRISRVSMLEVLSSDYITMARAKGLSELIVIGKHALRNALIPIVTYGGLLVYVMIGGAVVTESVFAYPGAGLLLVTTILSRDFPMVQAILFLSSLIVVVINLAVDILYSFIDPRIRYG